ncbi:MAG: transposase family protein, partial [Burkholderiales bacterium]|nr:transposase family protein [Burkholderiales bacterium]
MRHGFAYLSAVIDVASRRVLAHKLCTTLEAYHAVEIVEQAIHRYGTPEIVNTDQGSQFTALEFVESVTNRGIPCLCRSQRSTERCPSVARLVLFLGVPAAQCHGECIGDLFALASHLAQHDAQGKRLASTASEWSRSIISASGWRKKSAVRGGSDTGKPPGNWIPIR